MSVSEQVAHACWKAGFESSSLVIGVDFSASNEWKGRKSFGQNCLHKLIGSKVANPYQKVIAALGQALAPFDDDNKILAFGFGDAETRNTTVFPFSRDGQCCNGFEEVCLECFFLLLLKCASVGKGCILFDVKNDALAKMCSV